MNMKAQELPGGKLIIGDEVLYRYLHNAPCGHIIGADEKDERRIVVQFENNVQKSVHYTSICARPLVNPAVSTIR